MKSAKETELSYTASRFDAVVLHCDPFKDDVEKYMFRLEQEERLGVPPGFLQGQEVVFFILFSVKVMDKFIISVAESTFCP